MFDRQSIHIVLLLWGCIFSLIAAACVFMSKNFDKEKRKWLILMQLSCAGLLCNDACAWAFRGGVGAGAYVMVRISNFCVFSFSNIVLFFFHGYVLCCLALTNRQAMIRQKAVYGIALAGILLVIISQFTGLYYSFDSNNFYHRNAGYIVSVLLPMSGMLLDLSLINIAISISMILIFVVFMMEQNQLLARKEKETADLRISIMISQITPHFIYNNPDFHSTNVWDGS